MRQDNCFDCFPTTCPKCYSIWLSIDQIADSDIPKRGGNRIFWYDWKTWGEPRKSWIAKLKSWSNWDTPAGFVCPNLSEIDRSLFKWFCVFISIFYWFLLFFFWEFGGAELVSQISRQLTTIVEISSLIYALRGFARETVFHKFNTRLIRIEARVIPNGTWKTQIRSWDYTRNLIDSISSLGEPRSRRNWKNWTEHCEWTIKSNKKVYYLPRVPQDPFPNSYQFQVIYQLFKSSFTFCPLLLIHASYICRVQFDLV